MGGCMGQWVGSGQMTNLIKLELINIIWFCLKIYNLWRHPYLCVDGWVNGCAHVKPLKSNKSWPNRDNSIMDILDILLDILLKAPQPFIGLFLPPMPLSYASSYTPVPFYTCYVPSYAPPYISSLCPICPIEYSFLCSSPCLSLCPSLYYFPCCTATLNLNICLCSHPQPITLQYCNSLICIKFWFFQSTF